MSSALDFVTALDRGQEFTDRLDNKFDFSLFKVHCATSKKFMGLICSNFT